LTTVTAKRSPMRREKIALDSLDRKILDTLQKQGRLSNAKLALEVGLSESACFNRLRRLEQQKVILNYRALVDQASIASFIIIYVQVNIETAKLASYSRFEQMVARVPEIVKCDQVTGAYDYLLTIIARDMDDYMRIIEWLLETHGGVQQYSSLVVKKCTKDEPILTSYLLESRQ
jgi:Lrp/AsnC family transcriptional regulator of ectoine degradation